MDDLKDGQVRLGAAIRAERRRQNITQQVLAGMIGTTQDYVSDLEAGEYNIKVGRLWQIADALGVHPGDLMG